MGLIAVLVPDTADDMPARCGFASLRDTFGDRSYMALTLRRRPNDQMRIHELNNLAQRFRVATVVTNDVLFHEPARRILQDVVTCIRHNVTIDEAGFRRERHADRYLKRAGRDGAAVLALSGSGGADDGDRRPLHLQHGRTRLPVSGRTDHAGPDAAAGAGEADLGRRRRSAIRKACPTRSAPSSSTNCG